MKKQLLLLLLALISVTSASAYDFSAENDEGVTIYYDKIDDSNVEVTYKERNNESYSGIVNIPETVIHDGTTYSVTSIGSCAFEDCSSLASVIIPNSVTEIGGGAFRDCSGLTSVTIPNSVIAIGEWAFDGTVLTSVYISDIASWCRISFDDVSSNPMSFADNLYLNGELVSDLVIPDTVTSIGDYAFSGCRGLTSVTIGNSVTSIGTAAFSDCSGLTSVTIPNSVTSIGRAAFSGCSGLTSVTIPNSVTSIGDSAFWYCSGMTSVTIPNSVTSIGSSAFSGCRGLTSVTIGNSVTSIANLTFEYCDSLISVTIPDSVTSIGMSAFSSCSGLTSVTIGNSVTEIGQSAFSSCRGLTSVTIPNSVTSIGERAFSECWSLTSVKMGSSVASIGKEAFSGSAVNNMVFPNKVTTIPEDVLSCTPLVYVKLGENVQTIESYAFPSTLSLIEISNPVPPTLKKNAIPDDILPEVTVIVPSEEAEKEYRKANVWQDMTFTNPANVAEVSVETPGKLSVDLVKQCELMPAKVVSLKVKGTLDDADFEQMRINMKALLHLDLSEIDNTSVPDNALSQKLQLQSLSMPAKATSIGANAFDGCVFLNGELLLPAGVTEIGNEAFRGCGYTSFVLPSNMKKIGDYTFADMPLDMTLRLPETVESIGVGAFQNTGITGHLTFPDAVTSVGDYAFAGTKLSSVFMPRFVSTLGEGVFQNCTNLDVVDVPNNVKAIEGYAFQNCTGMVNLRLPSYLDDLGEYALSNTSIDYMTISKGLSTLRTGVMKGCGQMVSLSLPQSLERLESEALNGCRKLRNLSISATEPPVVADASVLRGINTDKCVISIPTTSFEDYLLASYWGQFVQMRNDIAVATEGNGTVSFEAAEETEEDEQQEPAPAQVARRSAIHRAASASPAENGSSVYVPKDEQVWFYFTPGSGDNLVSVTLDGVDITNQIVNGAYLATADKKNAKLVAKFSGEAPSSVHNAYSQEDNSGTVYNMQGHCLMRGASVEDMKSLPAGIYIVNGKKVVLK